MEPVEIRISRKADTAPIFPELGSAYQQGVLRSVGILEGGMESGKTSLWLNVQLKDGSWVCAQASAAIVEAIAGAVRGAEQCWAQGGK